jgi:hypothetical protein
MDTDDERTLSDLSAEGDPGWRSFSDRVMGGISREQATLTTTAELRCVRLQGEVRLENNGGFVQVALGLEQRGEPLDARAYSGVRLLVWGNGEEYLVHLRTRDTRLPWQLYRAPFVAGPAWQTVELPFATFRPERLAQPLDQGSLTRLGVVAYGRRFVADVAVARVALYR